MSAKKGLTDKQVATALEMRTAGTEWRAIAAHLQMTTFGLRKRLQRMGINVPLPRRKFSADEDALVISMRGSNQTWDAIAAALDCGRTAAIDRGKTLGFYGQRRLSATLIVRRTAPPVARDVPRVVRPSGDPLPPGHPETWTLITAGTLLDGASFHG